MDKTTPARPTSDGVIFTINVGAKERECSISRDALNMLSGMKNIDSSDADTLELFKAFETFIRPVAQSLFGRKGLQAPFQLTPENISTAYRSPITSQSTTCMTTLPSQAEAENGSAL